MVKERSTAMTDYQLRSLVVDIWVHGWCSPDMVLSSTVWSHHWLWHAVINTNHIFWFRLRVCRQTMHWNLLYAKPNPCFADFGFFDDCYYYLFTFWIVVYCDCHGCAHTHTWFFFTEKAVTHKWIDLVTSTLLLGVLIDAMLSSAINVVLLGLHHLCAKSMRVTDVIVISLLGYLILLTHMRLLLGSRLWLLTFHWTLQQWLLNFFSSFHVLLAAPCDGVTWFLR